MRLPFRRSEFIEAINDKVFAQGTLSLSKLEGRACAVGFPQTMECGRSEGKAVSADCQELRGVLVILPCEVEPNGRTDPMNLGFRADGVW